MDDDPSLPLFDALYVVGYGEGGGGEIAAQAADSSQAHSACSRVAAGTVRPSIQWLFEREGVADAALPSFCFPDAASRAPARPESFESDVFVFVLTGNGGRRRWGFCRRMLPPGPGGRYDVGRIRLPECICILSRRPCFGALSHLLAVACGIRTLALASDPIDARMWGLTSLLEDLARESSAHNSSSYLYAQGYRFCLPPIKSGESLQVPITPLLRQMGARGLITVLSALLCERRMIFVSERAQVLSQCIHAAVALLYPFRWQHLFIPVLPDTMLDHACAPMPFLMGVTAPLLQAIHRQPLSEVIIVNLDNGEVAMHGLGGHPPPDLGAGVKHRLVAATNKLDKAYTRTRNFLGKFGGDKDAGQGGSDRDVGGLQGDLTNYLFAEINSVHSKCAKAWPDREGCASFTAEDAALRSVMLVFFLCIFGDCSALARPQGSGPRGEPKSFAFDRQYFLNQRFERGDPEHLIKFLEEFTNAQMFEQFTRALVARQSPRDAFARQKSEAPPPYDFMRCVDAITRNTSSATSTSFNLSSVRRTVSGIIDGSLSSTYEVAAPGSPIRHASTPADMDAGSSSSQSSIMLAADLISRGASAAAAMGAIKELSRQAKDSSLVFGVMRGIWGHIEDSKGSKWRFAARALWLLRELLRSDLHNVLAMSLGHSSSLRELLREHTPGTSSSSERGATAVRRLARATLGAMMDVRQLSKMEVVLRGQNEQPRVSVELLPFSGRPLDFAVLHRLVGDSYGDGAPSTVDFGSILGAPPPLPPKPAALRSLSTSPRDRSELNEDYGGEGIWESSERPAETWSSSDEGQQEPEQEDVGNLGARSLPSSLAAPPEYSSPALRSPGPSVLLSSQKGKQESDSNWGSAQGFDLFEQDTAELPAWPGTELPPSTPPSLLESPYLSSQSGQGSGSAAWESVQQPPPHAHSNVHAVAQGPLVPPPPPPPQFLPQARPQSPLVSLHHAPVQLVDLQSSSSGESQSQQQPLPMNSVMWGPGTASMGQAPAGAQAAPAVQQNNHPGMMQIAMHTGRDPRDLQPQPAVLYPAQGHSSGPTQLQLQQMILQQPHQRPVMQAMGSAGPMSLQQQQWPVMQAMGVGRAPQSSPLPQMSLQQHQLQQPSIQSRELGGSYQHAHVYAGNVPAGANTAMLTQQQQQQQQQQWYMQGGQVASRSPAYPRQLQQHHLGMHSPSGQGGSMQQGAAPSYYPSAQAQQPGPYAMQPRPAAMPVQPQQAPLPPRMQPSFRSQPPQWAPRPTQPQPPSNQRSHQSS
jgi:hypothetical protein